MKALKKITFGRVLGFVAVLCLSWVTILITSESRLGRGSTEYLGHIYSSECHSYIKDGKYRIENMVTGKTTIKDIDWLLSAESCKDTLVVFSKNRKRGYFNRFTGEAVIPEQYTHAWVFSEGLAAVVSNEKVGFIDRQGKTVIDFHFPYLKDNAKSVAFVFRNGYSSMYDVSGKCGIIDKKGQWVLEPAYDCIHTPQYGKRIFDVGKFSGVLDDSLQILLSPEYKYIQLLEHYIIADKQDGSQVQIGYDGKVLNENIYSGVTILEYDSFEKTKEGGETIRKPTGLYSYSVYNSYGLMGQNGKPITPVLYGNITAIDKDLFLCTLKDSYSSVIINRQGTVIRNEAADLH